MTDGPVPPPRPDRAGWFDDPDDSAQLRYFDGILWTDHTTPRRTIWTDSAGTGTDTTSTTGPETAGGHPDATTRWPAAYPPQAPSTPSQGGPFGYPPAPGRAPHTGPGQTGGPYGTGYRRSSFPGSGPTTSDGTPLASLGARLGAWLVDSIITWILGLVLGGYLLWRGLGNYPEIVAEVLRTGTATTDAAALAERIQFDMAWVSAFAVLQLVIGVGYHTFFLSRTGATPGKQVVGVSVRSVDRPGVLSSSDALRRSMLRPMLWLFTFTPLFGLFAMPLSLFDAVLALWDPRRQTMHDKLGRTVVVQGGQERPPR